jgi:hypothetical protein
VLKKIDFRDLAIVTSALVIAFVLFSSPVFISNQIHFGSPLGPKALEMTSQASADVGLPEHVALMTGRWTYQLVDLQQFPEPILSRLMSAKAWLSQKITNITGLSLEKNSALLNEHEFGYTKQVPFSEDSAWYGLTGIFVFFAVSIYVIVQAIKLRHPLLIVGGALWFTAPISFALLRSGWTPYDGRYFIPLFAMLSLGLAVMLENLKPLFAKMLIWTLVTLSGVTLLLSI